MVKLFPPHPTVHDAAELQQELAEEVILRDDIPVDLKKMCGIFTHSRSNEVTVSGAVLSFPDLKVQEKKLNTEHTEFPQIASFRGFRESKAIVDLIDKFKKQPELLMIFGHGINHPRKFGLACHVGMAISLPTIAVARDLLCGKIEKRGSKEVIVDDEEVVGEVAKYNAVSPSLFVSPGYMVTIDSATKIVNKTLKSPIPEPIKIAQQELLKGIKTSI